MAGNPSFNKRLKERQRQEKQQLKQAKKEQRRRDRANGIAPVESTGEQLPPEPTPVLE
jgi:hypothetical protein